MGLGMEEVKRSRLGARLEMNSREEATYWVKFAAGYIEEAEKLFVAKLWRACAGSCQLAVENACKAVIALFRPVIKTHEVSKLLFDLLAGEEFSKNEVQGIEKLADYAKILGLKEHILTDYGDELTYTKYPGIFILKNTQERLWKSRLMQ